MALKRLGRSSLAQGRKVRSGRRVYLPELDGEKSEFISATCKTPRHSNCSSLRCICECHNQCLPVGDDYRCKKVGS
jgi:hypothetical protein